MKIRQGFVSNSSTTSFCIYGTQITPKSDEVKEEENEYYDAGEDLYEQCEKVGLECHSSPYDSFCWVGEEWSSMGDDETGSQFKARVEAKLFKHFKVKPDECNTFEEAWRDG